MRVEIFGAGLGSAYAAALLSSSQVSVLWYMGPAPESLRPVLLRNSLLKRLKRFLTLHGVSADFLDQGLELEAWGTPEGSRTRFFFPWSQTGGSDRWVDREALLQGLMEAARRMGAAICPVPRYPEPRAEDHFSLAELGDEEVPHWPSRLQPGETQFPWHFVELRYLRVREEEGAGIAEFSRLGEGLGCLEPHPAGGAVLSLAAPSRRALEKSLALLTHPKGEGPRHWRLLHLANPGASHREGILKSGASAKQFRGVYALGPAVGLCPPWANVQASESLEQVERLFEQILDIETSPELWLQEETRHFQQLSRKLRLWEKAVLSSNFREEALFLTSCLPPGWRHYLKAPI